MTVVSFAFANDGSLSLYRDENRHFGDRRGRLAACNGIRSTIKHLQPSDWILIQQLCLHCKVFRFVFSLNYYKNSLNYHSRYSVFSKKSSTDKAGSGLHKTDRSGRDTERTISKNVWKKAEQEEENCIFIPFFPVVYRKMSVYFDVLTDNHYFSLSRVQF